MIDSQDNDTIGEELISLEQIIRILDRNTMARIQREMMKMKKEKA